MFVRQFPPALLASLILLAALLFLGSGCGYRGPLYLPDETGAEAKEQQLVDPEAPGDEELSGEEDRE